MFCDGPRASRAGEPGRGRNRDHPVGEDAAMDTSTDIVTVCMQQGRKGIAYDWHSLFAAAEAESFDSEIASILPALAE